MKTISAIIILFILGLWFGSEPKKQPEYLTIKKINLYEKQIDEKELYCRELEKSIIEKQITISEKLNK